MAVLNAITRDELAAVFRDGFPFNSAASPGVAADQVFAHVARDREPAAESGTAADPAPLVAAALDRTACPYITAETAPCAIRDGKKAIWEGGTACAGCGREPADMLRDLARRSEAAEGKLAAIGELIAGRYIADRIDQVVGWAKAGERGGDYLMDREKTDRMRDDILSYAFGCIRAIIGETKDCSEEEARDEH